MSSHRNDAAAAAVLDRMFEAEFGFMASPAGDLDSLARIFHADCKIHEPASLPYGGVWRGLTGVAKLIRAMGEAWSKMAIEDRSATLSGNTLYMRCELSLTARVTKITLAQPFAQVIRIADDRVVEATPFYFDTGALSAVLTTGVPANYGSGV